MARRKATTTTAECLAQIEQEIDTKEQELKENNMLLGNTDVTGEGVEVFLEDATTTDNNLNASLQIIHYDDLQSNPYQLFAAILSQYRSMSVS